MVNGNLCILREQVKISDDIYRVTLESPLIAGKAIPGQFVHIQVSKSQEPLLRRPFSIHRVNESDGTIQVLYRVIGRGTALMAEAKVGEAFDTMGPLGNGFDLVGDYEHALILAGGMGSAPAFFLLDGLIAQGKKVHFLWGAKKGAEIFHLEQLEKLGVDVHIATEDGSMAHCGFVTDLLHDFLSDKNQDEFRGFVCGPHGMLSCVHALALETTFPWQVSMEERMACAVGVCLGCMVKTQEGQPKMVCSHGPVFDLKEMAFDG